MRFTSFLFLFLLVLLAIPISYVQDYYFDFSAVSNVTQLNKDFQVNLDYSLSGVEEQDFMIKPSVSKGSVEIFNNEKNIWVRFSSLRSDFPKLSKTINLKLAGVPAEKTELCFDIQHLKTGKMFKTPCKTIWNKNFFAYYFSLLNQRLGAINGKILK